MKYLLLISLFINISNFTFAIEPVFDIKKFSVTYPKDNDSNKTYIPLDEETNPKITLLLSGGGARGLSQVGVLRMLEEYDIKISNIVGTSIGAFIGGLYSSGYTAQQLIDLIDTTSWDELFSLDEHNRRDYFLDQKEIDDRSWLRLRFHNFDFIMPDAISTGKRFNDYLNRLLWNCLYHADENYDKLKYNFRATATDLVKGEPVIFNSGNLSRTIRASGNLPLRNSPVQIDSMLLIDGGIFQNIPIDAAKGLDTDLMILVNTVSPIYKKDDLNSPWNIADQVVSIMMKKFEESSHKTPDIIISPKLDSITNTDFWKSKQLLNLGYDAVDIKMITDRINKLREQKINNYYNINYSKYPFPLISTDSLANDSLRMAITAIINNITFNDRNRFTFFISTAKQFDLLELFLQSADDGRVFLKATEYPRITGISISSNEVAMNNIAENIDKIFVNRNLNSTNFNKICEIIITYLRTLKYPFAAITECKFKDGIISLRVNEGKAETIEIKSKIYSKDYLVQRELKIAEGKALKTDDISNSWDNLITTELFSDVEFEFKKSKSDTSVDVSIMMKEKGNQMITFGAYLDNERYLNAGIDLIHLNLFNTGASFTLRTVGGARNFKSQAILSQQRFLNTMITAGLSFYYDIIKRWTFVRDFTAPTNRFRVRRYDETVDEAFGLKATAGFQLAKFGNISFVYRFERQRSFLRDSLPKPKFYNVNTISLGTKFDTRDRLDFAKRGRYINLLLETSLFKTTTEPTFSRLYFIQVNNYSIGAHTFRPKLIFGLADRTLPFNEFFRMGGEQSFYGYNEDEILGRQLVLGSLEYEVKLPFTIIFDTYFSMRYDIGSAWLSPETIKFRNLKHGFGMSLSLDTPIGPARFSTGEAFYFISNPNGAKLGYPHFYFSIGLRL